MALKRILTKAEFEKLPADIKAEYKEDGESFALDIIGDEDVSALRRAKDREASARKDAEAKNKELQTQLDAMNSDDVRKVKDAATIDKEWKTKTDQLTATHAEQMTKMQTHIKTSLIDGAAVAMASKISTVPALMSKAIKERLTVDFSGDAPALKILGADGKPSDLTLDKLEQEFVTNKDFSSIIVGSKATGGGAGTGGQKPNGGGAATQTSDKPVPLSQMNPRALAAHLAAKRESQE